MQLKKLDEIKANALLMIEAIKKRLKNYYNNKLRSKSFMLNDLVLL